MFVLKEFHSSFVNQMKSRCELSWEKLILWADFVHVEGESVMLISFLQVFFEIHTYHINSKGIYLPFPWLLHLTSHLYPN